MENKSKPTNDTKEIEIPFPIAITIIIYTLTVLLLDTFITFDIHFIFSWGNLNITLFDILTHIPKIRDYSSIVVFQNFDLMKFLFWLIVPFFVFIKFLDFRWFSMKRWARSDYIVFLFFIVICLLSLVFVVLSQTLRMYYPGLKMMSINQKLIFFIQQLLWVVSWLPGWEFLNRHLLLRSCKQVSKRYGWFFVPVVETLYHVHKAFLEIIGMFIFSVFACWWSIKRENNVLAFLCHFAVELGLIVLILFT